ncbi:MAG: DUF748 domain-containing protein, partial [Duodenibacillus sp.]|nr:DUF748 domain-containing protein [Duodenibacillus sp.]
LPKGRSSRNSPAEGAAEPAEPAKPGRQCPLRNHKKTKAALCTAAALGVLYTGAGFLGVPYGVNYALEKVASPLLMRSVTAQKVYFNPFTLRFRLEGLKIEKPGEKPLLEMKRFETKVGWESVLHLDPHVNEVTLDGLDAYVERTGLAQFSVTDLIDKFVLRPGAEPEPAPAEEAAGEPLKFEVANIKVSNVNVTVDDKFRNGVDKLTDLTLSLPVLTNHEEKGARPAEPELSFKLNDEPFEFGGESRPFAISKKTGIDLEVRNLDLPNLYSFVPDPMNFKVKSGKLNFKFNLNFSDKDEVEGHRYLRLKGAVGYRDLEIVDTLGDEKPLFAVDSIDVDIPNLAVFAQKADIASVTVTRPRLRVELDPDGGVNLLKIAARPFKTTANMDQLMSKDKPAAPETVQEAAAAMQQETPAPERWDWIVREIKVVDGSVDFEDQSSGFAQPVTGLQVGVSNLTDAKDQTTAVSLDLGVLGGTVHTEGKVSLADLAIELDVENKDIDIVPTMAYARPFTALKVLSGKVSEKGRLSVKAKDGLDLNYAGTTGIAGFALAAPDGAKLASFDALEVDLKEMSLSGRKAEVASVRLVNPQARVVLDADGGDNWSKALAVPGVKKAAPKAAPAEKPKQEAKQEPKQEAKQEAKPAQPAGPWTWSVAKIGVSGGAVQFKDAKAGFEKTVSNIRADVGNLTLAKGATTTFDAGCSVLGGQIKVGGSAQIAAKTAAVTAEASKLGVTEVKPYLKDVTPLNIVSGLAGLSAKAQVALPEQGGPDVKLDASSTLESFKVADKAGNPLVSFDKLAVDKARVEIKPELKVQVASVVLDKPRVSVQRAKDGKINLLTAMGVSQEAPKADGKKPEAAKPAPKKDAAPLPDVKV